MNQSMTEEQFPILDWLLSQEILIEASQLLPGDGYTRYVKPFRTIEDLHIFAAYSPTSTASPSNIAGLKHKKNNCSVYCSQPEP